MNLDAYIRSRVAIRNDDGGRGYDEGIRTFDCPHCHDRKGRGWMNILRWTAGCWNLGCLAEPRVDGGALEWARVLEDLNTRGRTWHFLNTEFPGESSFQPTRLLKITDWCVFPKTAHWFSDEETRLEYPYRIFIKAQWGLSRLDAIKWELGWSFAGRYRLRVIIPIIMDHRPVAFQARTIHPMGEPKYLTSKHGEYGTIDSECGRPARALLFNLDAAPSQSELMLVEGPGDVMQWTKRRQDTIPFGLLGTALTPEKIGLIAIRRPRRVIVALDAEPEAQRRALAHVEDLEAWGIPAVLGTWSGGKDAGSGARLDVKEALGLADQIRARLRS